MSSVKSAVLIGALVMMSVCSAWATTTTSLSPDIVGSVGANTGGILSGTLYVGNSVAEANHMFVTIEKYSINSITESAQNVTLSGTIVNNSASGYYFIVQHYTYDNSVALCWDDAKLSNTGVETISGVETPAVTGYSWNVTDYVNADLAVGNTHSSFRIVMTDVTGTPVNTFDGERKIIQWASSPSLSVTVPEPLTLVCSGLGLLGLIRRNRA